MRLAPRLGDHCLGEYTARTAAGVKEGFELVESRSEYGKRQAAAGQGKGFHFGDTILPVAVSLLATACYGWATHMARIWLAHVPPLVMTCAGLLSGALLLAPLALWLWPEHSIPAQAWSMAFGLAIVSTAIAYLVFYRLIGVWGATKTTTVTYLVPVFGMLWGSIFLGEHITLTMVLGGMVIIAGVMILSYKRTPAPVVSKVVAK